MPLYMSNNTQLSYSTWRQLSNHNVSTHFNLKKVHYQNVSSRFFNVTKLFYLFQILTYFLVRKFAFLNISMTHVYVIIIGALRQRSVFLGGPCHNNSWKSETSIERHYVLHICYSDTCTLFKLSKK